MSGHAAAAIGCAVLTAASAWGAGRYLPAALTGEWAVDRGSVWFARRRWLITAVAVIAASLAHDTRVPAPEAGGQGAGVLAAWVAGAAAVIMVVTYANLRVAVLDRSADAFIRDGLAHASTTSPSGRGPDAGDPGLAAPGGGSSRPGARVVARAVHAPTVAALAGFLDQVPDLGCRQPLIEAHINEGLTGGHERVQEMMLAVPGRDQSGQITDDPRQVNVARIDVGDLGLAQVLLAISASNWQVVGRVTHQGPFFCPEGVRIEMIAIDRPHPHP